MFNSATLNKAPYNGITASVAQFVGAIITSALSLSVNSTTVTLSANTADPLVLEDQASSPITLTIAGK